MQTTIPQSLYSAMRFNFLYVDKYTLSLWMVFPGRLYPPIVCSALLLRGEVVFKINSEEIRSTQKMRSFT